MKTWTMTCRVVRLTIAVLRLLAITNVNADCPNGISVWAITESAPPSRTPTKPPTPRPLCYDNDCPTNQVCRTAYSDVDQKCIRTECDAAAHCPMYKKCKGAFQDEDCEWAQCTNVWGGQKHDGCAGVTHADCICRGHYHCIGSLLNSGGCYLGRRNLLESTWSYFFPPAKPKELPPPAKSAVKELPRVKENDSTLAMARHAAPKNRRLLQEDLDNVVGMYCDSPCDFTGNRLTNGDAEEDEITRDRKWCTARQDQGQDGFHLWGYCEEHCIPNGYNYCTIYNDPHIRTFYPENADWKHTPPHNEGWFLAMHWKGEGHELKVLTNHQAVPERWDDGQTSVHTIRIEVLNHNGVFEQIYSEQIADNPQEGDSEIADQFVNDNYVTVLTPTLLNPVDYAFITNLYQNLHRWDRIIKVNFITDFGLYTQWNWWGYRMGIKLHNRALAGSGIRVSEFNGEGDDHSTELAQLPTCDMLTECCGEKGAAEYNECLEDAHDDCCNANADVTCCNWMFRFHCGALKNEDEECAHPEAVCDESNGQCYRDRYPWLVNDEEVYRDYPKCSAKSCRQFSLNEFNPGADNGIPTVCGYTGNSDHPEHSVPEQCPGEQSYDDAEQYCKNQDGRLCTRPELLQGEGSGVGVDGDCGLAMRYSWSQSLCALDSFYVVNYKWDDLAEVECVPVYDADYHIKPHGGRCCFDDLDLPGMSLDNGGRLCRTDECASLDSAIYLYSGSSVLEFDGFNIVDPHCTDTYHTEDGGIYNFTRCPEPGQPWTAAGCFENECTIAPEWLSGFATDTNGNKYIGEFQSEVILEHLVETGGISVMCEDGYGGVAKAISCFDVDGGPVTLEGCEPVYCSLPLDVGEMDGYEVQADPDLLWSALRDNEIQNFWESDSCADGYFGTPQLNLCHPHDGGEVTLHGCFPITCQDPTGDTRIMYVVDDADPFFSTQLPDFNVPTECNSPHYHEVGDGPMATECSENSEDFQLSGCQPSVCVSPDNTEGYVIANVSVLSLPVFNVITECEEGYGPEAIVEVCIAHDQNFALTGCDPVVCDPPSPVDTLGYFLHEAESMDLSWLTLDVLDRYECQTGYFGTPSVINCDANGGGEFELQGCQAGECIYPTDGTLEHYDIMAIDLRWQSFDVTTECAEFYYPGENGTDWERCDDHAEPFFLSGCFPEECNSKTDSGDVPEGLNIQEFVLDRAGFDVRGSCQDGYGGDPTFQMCGAHNLGYTVSGCGEEFCSPPDSTDGYQILSSPFLSLSRVPAHFSVLETANCADNYVGAPVATRCNSHSNPYKLEGCVPGFCNPAETDGYIIGENPNLLFTEFDVEAECAEHYTQADIQVMAHRCPSIDEPYTLTGCEKIMCTRPATYDGYIIDESSLWTGAFAVHASCDTENGYVAGEAELLPCTVHDNPYSLSGCKQADIFDVEPSNVFNLYFPADGYESDTGVFAMDDFCIDTPCSASDILKPYFEITVPLTTYELSDDDRDFIEGLSVKDEDLIYTGRYVALSVRVAPNYKAIVEARNMFVSLEVIGIRGQNRENAAMVEKRGRSHSIELDGALDATKPTDFTVVITTHESTDVADLLLFMHFTPTQHNGLLSNDQPNIQKDDSCWAKVASWAHDFVPPGGVSWYEVHTYNPENACQWYGELDEIDEWEQLCCPDGVANTTNARCNDLIQDSLVNCEQVYDEDSPEYERENMCYADFVTQDQQEYIADGEQIPWGTLTKNCYAMEAGTLTEDPDGDFCASEKERIYAYQVCPNCGICIRNSISLDIPPLYIEYLHDYDYDYEYSYSSSYDGEPTSFDPTDSPTGLYGRRLLAEAEENFDWQKLVTDLVPGLTGMKFIPYVEPSSGRRRNLKFLEDENESEEEMQKELLKNLNDPDPTSRIKFRTYSSRRNMQEGDILGYLTGDWLDGSDLAEKHDSALELYDLFDIAEENRAIVQTMIQGDQEWGSEAMSTFAADFEDVDFVTDTHDVVSYVLGEAGVNCIQACMTEKLHCDEFGFPKNEGWVKQMDLVVKTGGDLNKKAAWNKKKRFPNKDPHSIFFGTCKPKQNNPNKNRWLTDYPHECAPALYAIDGGDDIESLGFCLPEYSGTLTDKRCQLQHHNLKRFCPCVGGLVVDV